MAIVVETVNRSGQVLACHVFDKETITIGRAYHNDLVLADNYIDPVHVQLNYPQDADSIICEDQHSTNGVYDAKQNKLPLSSQLEPGKTITIGKTLLRISSMYSKVEPAIPLSFWEELSDTLTQWWFIICSSLLLGILIIINIYVSKPLLTDKTTEFMQLVYYLIGLGIYGGLFSFIGRIFHHDSRFFLYYALLCCSLIVIFLYDWLSYFILFNGHFSSNTGWLDNMVFSIIIAGLLDLSFRFATHMRRLIRGVIALVLPGLVLMNMLVDFAKNDNDFSYRPDYNATVLHQSLYWRQTTSPQYFIESSQALYKQARDHATQTPEDKDSQ